jgi:hypothetical protein
MRRMMLETEPTSEHQYLSFQCNQYHGTLKIPKVTCSYKCLVTRETFRVLKDSECLFSIASWYNDHQNCFFRCSSISKACAASFNSDSLG